MFTVDGISFNALTSAQVRLFREYNSALRKAGLAQIIDYLLSRPTFIGSFVNAAGANASSHPLFPTGVFAPGDTYYDTTATHLEINTATTVGPATWTAVV